MPGGYNLWTATDRNPLYWDRGATPQSVLDEFSAWMHEQPWWQAIRATTDGDLSDAQRREIARHLMNQEGVVLNDQFHIDEAGNVDQKGTLKRNLGIAAGIAAGVAGGGYGLGLWGGGAAASGAGGAGSVAGMSPALSPATALSANLGTASALPSMAAPGLATLPMGGALPNLQMPVGTTLPGGLETLPAGGTLPNIGRVAGQKLPTGAARNPLTAALSAGAKKLRDNWKKGIPIAALAAGRALSPGGNSGAPNGANNLPPELQQMLALSVQRMRDQEPLFQAINRQALAGLPTYAKGGQ